MIQPSVVKSKSSGRVHESIVETCTQLIARIANSKATSDDTERLPALAQPEVAARAHAQVVVDEADEREPDDEDQQASIPSSRTLTSARRMCATR